MSGGCPKSGWTAQGRTQYSLPCSSITLSRTVLNGLSGNPNHDQNHGQNHEQNHEQNYDSSTMSQTINHKPGLDPIDHQV